MERLIRHCHPMYNCATALHVCIVNYCTCKHVARFLCVPLMHVAMAVVPAGCPCGCFEFPMRSWDRDRAGDEAVVIPCNNNVVDVYGMQYNGPHEDRGMSDDPSVLSPRPPQ